MRHIPGPLINQKLSPFLRDLHEDLAIILDNIAVNRDRLAGALISLKVRYVITYKSSAAGNLDSPRKVRVELVNPKTGGPIQIVDASGKTIHAHVVLEDSYVPSKAAGAQP